MHKKIPIFTTAALLILVDQLTKLLTRTYIGPLQHVAFLPGILDFTYVQNTGAAFSSFSSSTVFLALLSLVMSVLMAVAILRNWLRHPAGQWILAIIMAGALGNFIDRAFMGFVTDMIEVLFMDFAVFNFADICVVLGSIAMAIYIIFFYDKLEGCAKTKGCPQEEHHVSADSEG